MNSPIAPRAVIHAGRRLFRFDHPSQWQSRPAWRPSIDPKVHAPAFIIGGYNLGKELWQHCGLCKREHGRGYVIATTDELETHIGKDCGYTHFDVLFKDLERDFSAALDLQDRADHLRDLLSRRAGLLADAEATMATCEKARATVAWIMHRIEREKTLSKSMDAFIDRDGLIALERRASEAEFETFKQRFVREPIGRIDGYGARRATPPTAAIRCTVLPFLRTLTAEALSGLSSARLREKSKEADAATTLIQEGKVYVELARRFAAGENWQAFASMFAADRLPTNDRGRRILGQLVDRGWEQGLGS